MMAVGGAPLGPDLNPVGWAPSNMGYGSIVVGNAHATWPYIKRKSDFVISVFGCGGTFRTASHQSDVLFDVSASSTDQAVASA